MPRRARTLVGGLIYHVLNRSNGRTTLFRRTSDYEAFIRTLVEAHERTPLRILFFCVMPTHWHFVVWPRRGPGGEVSDFFRWLTLTHTQRWHACHHTAGTGHLYQGRFKSFPIEQDEHFYTVARYVERNPLRAGLVDRAEQWRHGSLAMKLDAKRPECRVLTAWPLAMPPTWIDHVNQPQTDAEAEAVRRSIARGAPFGGEAWTKRTVAELGLEHTQRPRGRPKKAEQ
ncbi:MAG TPA: transposase [Lacipirellulaceae bacterium]|nr:transposase [Lacipirellulaceae bacterium]